MSVRDGGGLFNLTLRKAALWIVLITSLVHPSPAPALDPSKRITQYMHQVWSTKNGLPENNVEAIVQTDDGFLWLGTQKGLARFDGTRFSIVDHRQVWALTRGHDGGLWVGTTNGLIHRSDGRVATYSLGDGLPSTFISALWTDFDGSLWVITSGGVARGNGKFVTDSLVEQTVRTAARQVFRDRQGNLYIATTAGLKVLSHGGVTTYTTKDGLSNDYVKVIFQDRRGTLWIGTVAGLNRLVNGKVASYSLGGRMPHPEITALLEDRDGNLWIGTATNGLFRLNQQGMANYSTADGLSHDNVQSLYEDRDGNLWVGTLNGGLDGLRDGVFTPYGKPEGFSSNDMWGVLEGKDGSLWAGTQPSGLDRLNKGKIATYVTRPNIYALCETRDGTLWLGGTTGVSQFRHGAIIPARVPPALAHGLLIVRAIYEDPSGALWFGTKAGLFRLKDGQYTAYTTRNGLPNNEIWEIIGSRDGGLWLGTVAGLSYFKDGKFRNYSTQDGLAADLITALYEDREGTLWIGAGGLNRFKQGRFTAYTDRLPDNDAFVILEDDHGYLWMSSNRGVFRVRKQELNEFAEGGAKSLTSIAYGTEDGLRVAECNGSSQPSGWKDRHGNLWFATPAGLASVDPGRATETATSLQVQIESLSANKNAVGLVQGVRLPPGAHELEFHYTAPSLWTASKVRFKYKLEGFDKDWVDASTREVAYYTNIPPGAYRFHVLASMADGTQKEANASIDLYLTPYFYQTCWFFALCVLALLASGWTVYRIRLRHLEKLNRELANKIAERTRELQVAKEAAELAATRDFLTGLLNRAATEELLKSETTRSARNGLALSVIVADVDRFKLINDTHGHWAGDVVLQEIASRLKSAVRGYDTIGRYGGDEFVVVAPNCNLDEGMTIAERARTVVSTRPVTVNGVDIPVTISLGISSSIMCGLEAATLLREADAALYQSKAAGRNVVQAVRPERP